MDTEDVAVLVAAASAGSLAGAARRLKISPMKASRRLAVLEDMLGVRLMHRTTRALSLTPEGEAFLPYAQALVEGEAAGRASLKDSTLGATGLLRITAPAAFGRKIIMPILPALMQEQPHLRVDLELTDRVVDIVASGADLAIRVAPLRDNSLIARKLSGCRRILCAAPAYLNARGRPQKSEDLTGHDCLSLTGTTHWPFLSEGLERRVRIGGRFSSNSVESLLFACLDGMGIALLAEWNVGDDIRAGRLIALSLEDMIPGELAIWAVYPSARTVLPKLKIFIAALQNALATKHPAPDLTEKSEERTPNMAQDFAP